jgi:hypothetical protein
MTKPLPFTAIHPADRRQGETYEAYEHELWIMHRAVCKIQATDLRVIFSTERRKFMRIKWLWQAKRWNDYPFETVCAWERIIETAYNRIPRTRTVKA